MQAHLWEKAREAKDTAVRLLGGIPPEQLPTLLCALASLYEVKRELSLKAFDSLTLDYSPNQPRDRYGRWSNGGITKGLTGGEESGKLKSSQKISATGANKFEKGFSEKNLARHWTGGDSDHSKEYPSFTKEQYAQRALNLVQSPADGKNILGYCTKDGAVARYDTRTNDFVKGYPQTGVATMFKPSRGKKYFDEHIKSEGDDGG